MNYRHRLALVGATSMFALGLAPGAWAQTTPLATPSAEPAPAVSVSQESSDELVVTARRRTERLQDVPLALTVLNADALDRQNIDDIASLSGKVPGLVVANSLGGGHSTPTFAIRGQSQQELSGVSDPSVTLYVNDVPVARPFGANLALFDVAGVEVAKGPQGTLFGRNTTGGAILVRLQQPKDHFEASLSQTIASRNTSVTEAMVNLPLGENAALRISGQRKSSDGYVYDVVLNRDVNTVDENAIRASLWLRLTPNLETVTTAAYSKAENGGTGGFVYYSQNAAFLPGLADQATRDIYHIASGVPMFENIDTWSVDNQTTLTLNDNFTLKNIAAYRNLDFHNLEDLDGTSSLLFPVERFVYQDQFSEELQLQGTFGRFDFITGAFYFRETPGDQALTSGALSGTGQTDPGLLEPGSITAYSPRYSNTWVESVNTSYAVFFQGNYKFTDNLSITAGVRQNWDEREVVIRNRSFQPAISTTDLSCRFTLDEDNNPATAETRPTLANCAFTGSTEFDELTYNLSLQYKVRPDILLYAAHRHGYRTGGFSARGNSQVRINTVFQPELVDDFEVGAKADWRFNEMFLRTNLALYSAEYTDMQRILQQGLAPPVSVVTNAGGSTIQGAEFDFIFRPTDWLELSGSYAYTDAMFDQFIGPNGDDFSGQIFPRAPKNSISFTSQVTLPVDPEAGEVRWSLTYTHQDRYDYSDDYAIERTTAGVPVPAGVLYNRAQIISPQDLFSTNLQWSSVMGSSVDLSAFVTNLFDKQYKIPYMGVVSAFDTRTAGEPRTIGVRAKLNFQ